MVIRHKLFVVAVVVMVFMPMTLSVLPPAQWSSVEGPRISKQDGEYCFSYDENSVVAPHLWYRTCGSFYPFYGANQSPVIIDPRSVWSTCSPENRLRYDSHDSVTGTLENDGYYAKFTDLEDERKLYGVPGYQDTGFQLGSIHIHIGKSDDASRRTEHGVFGKHYDAEVHMVHSRGEGSGQVAGLAVVGIFLSTTEGEENEEINRLLDKVENIIEYEGEVCKQFFTYCDRTDNGNGNGNGNGVENGSIYPPYLHDLCKFHYTKEIDYLSYLQRWYGRGISARLGETASRMDSDYCWREDEQCPHHGNGEHNCGGVDLKINPEKLLPSPRDYYYYYGSLTTPTLSESVLWQVMMTPLRITEQQLKKLEAMKSRIPGALISDFGNVRPLQNLNGRQILANVCG